MEHKWTQEGITFDDVLLVPQYSNVTPDRADTRTRLTRNISLNIPLVSAPMDTVTESALAIALAQEGGIGIVHKNLSPGEQAREVVKVKRSENGVITDPVTLSPGDTVSRATALMAEQNVSGFPVTEDGSARGRVVGILTRRDMKFVDDPTSRVADVMTREHLITAPATTGPEQAEKILNQARVEKLLLVDGDGCLAGLITMRDLENIRTHPHACRDARGRLRVGAAVGVDQMERVERLIEAEADVIVVDTAHGHTENVINTVAAIRKRYDIEIIAGNVATEEGAKDLIAAGVDAVKVGIGPGSICTTRVVTGVGMPQLTAIVNACRAADDANVPVIADGGVRQSGDIGKAIAAGASSVMLGSLFAGMDESPGELILHRGRRYKTYRGMGSEGAMGAGSADRYGQAGIAETRKFVPEGVEGRVPYRGPLAEFVYQMVGGLRSTMGYCGCATIEELREHARFVRVTGASLVESHPHDIQITRESPNYSTANPIGE
ncbi:MAG: IMP dehydrogenase [Phycisphaerales bacterium]|nr:IMP dehydrogenase [Phycisphaerae bacterium]NNF44164.1 IMP dehydrogenase [Phycisphaerales bacterium]NNM26512.1 IMP dehydrogenase [Phycisphaerales bacterium]